MLKNFSRENLLKHITTIDFSKYQQKRNYISYKCSQLSPFISCGIIGIQDLLDALTPNKKYKNVIFQLYWRYYFQQVWDYYDNKIFLDLKFKQAYQHKGLPSEVLRSDTGISILDQQISQLVEHSHIHNHARLWLSCLLANFYSYHWLEPAKWMFYHLLDGDFASNFLSWQWVAGTSRAKKYLFNLSNLNKYSNSNESVVAINLSYEEIESLYLDSQSVAFDLKTNYEKFNLAPCDDTVGEVNLLTIFTLGAYDESKTNVLFVDKVLFDEFPISDKRIEFVLKVIEDNGFKIYLSHDISSFTKLSATYHSSIKKYKNISFIKKEMPLFDHNKFNAEKSFFYNWKNIEKRYD